MSTYGVNYSGATDNAETLRNYKNRYAEHSENLNAIKLEISENWKNDEGADITSVIAKFEECISVINNVVTPAIESTSIAIEDLVERTQRTSTNEI